MSIPEFEIFELPNGLKVIFKQVASEAAHCGVIINAGTRDEQEDEQGLAHYIEHVLFKGTTKRKFYHILSRIDSVGGELNAYTAKEETCIYASFHRQYLQRAIELIADVTFNAVFPEREIEKEKDVIIDEINAYKDTPAEQIYDDFESLAFAAHPLGNNILGCIESIKKFNRQSIRGFIEKHYHPANMVFSIAGAYSLNTIKQIIEKYFGVHTSKTSAVVRQAPQIIPVFDKLVHTNANQAHCMIGNRAPSSIDSQKTAMVLLNNLLGGPGMNSRLNLNIREKYGFAYNLDSSYVAYSDAGLFTVYLGTDKKQLDKTKQLVLTELKKLRQKPLSTLQLKRAKRQLCGNIALAQENNCNVMLGLGKSLLLYNRVDTLQTIYKEIENITSAQLFELANEVFEEHQLSTLIFK